MLCIITGILAGLIVIPFRYILAEMYGLRSELFSHSYGWAMHILIIAIMWIVAMAIMKWVIKIPDIAGSGIPQTAEIIDGRLKVEHPVKKIITKFIGGVLSIGMGLSLSRGGPSVEIGGLAGKIVGNKSKSNSAVQHYIQTAGGAAGMSAAFTSPLSATLFFLEGISHFSSVKIAISAFLASGVAGWMAYYAFPVNKYAGLSSAMPGGVSIPLTIILFMAFALIISFAGKLFNYSIISFQKYNRRLKIPLWVKILALVTLTYIIGYDFPSLLSDGEDFLIGHESSVISFYLLIGLIIIKIFLTAICYSFGFPGGIFLPLLVIGGLIGKSFGMMLMDAGIIATTNYGFFIVLGMASMFASSIRTPVTSILFTVEVTQQFSAMLAMIIFVGMTYFISEMIRTKPIYESLYYNLIPEKDKTPFKHIDVDFILSPKSFMNGKKAGSITLPAGCKIIAVARKDKPIPLQSVLMPDDVIKISVPSDELEHIYVSLQSLADN